MYISEFCLVTLRIKLLSLITGTIFQDEFHTRLRFVRRGLVAMANSGPNDNGSQFFFTLGPTPELMNKHTIFAKVSMYFFHVWHCKKYVNYM